MTTINHADVRVFYPTDMDILPLGSTPRRRSYNAGRAESPAPFYVLPVGWRVKRQWVTSEGYRYAEFCPYAELGGTDTMADEAVSTE